MPCRPKTRPRVLSLLLLLPTSLTASDLAPGATLEGALEPGDAIDEFDQGFVDRVRLDPGNARLLRLELRSEHFDAFLVLRTNGMVVAVADDIDNLGGNFDARLDFEVPEGTLEVEVSSAFGDGWGPWQLSLEEIDFLPSGYGEWSDLAEQLTNAPALTERPDGELGPTSQATLDGNRFELRRLPVKAGVRYELRLYSGDFDTYLALLDLANREQLAANDDDLDGDGSHSCLRFTAPRDAELAVVVDSFESTDRGRFHLELSEFGPAPARAEPEPSSREGVEPSK